MWRSLVAHLFWEQRVAGSNPVIPTDSSRPDQSVRAASLYVRPIRSAAFRLDRHSRLPLMPAHLRA